MPKLATFPIQSLSPDIASRMTMNPLLDSGTNKAMNRSNKSTVTKTQKAKKRTALRCFNCEGCKTPDCGECIYCKDKPKFGGRNSLRRPCSKKVCIVSI